MNGRSRFGQAAVFQLLILSAVFALPLVSGGRLSLLSSDILSEILVLEFAVVVVGGFIFGLFALPSFFADNSRLRWVTLGLSLLIALPLTSQVIDEYGWSSGALFLWLLFITYGGVFVTNMAFQARGRLLVETGYRWLISFLLFATLAAVLDTPVNVETWGRHRSGLLFGVLYFGILGSLDVRRYFARATTFTYRVLGGQWQPRPRSRMTLDHGQIVGHVTRRARVHMWWLGLIVGAICLLLVGVFAHASLQLESLAARIALWLFLAPFALIGAALVLAAPIMLRDLLRSVRPGFALDALTYHASSKVQGDGVVPRFRRQGLDSSQQALPELSAFLAVYQIEPPATLADIAVVNTEYHRQLLSGCSFQTSADRFDFSVDATLPESLQPGPVESVELVRHLIIQMEDGNESWSVAFPLPEPKPV